MTEPLWLQVAPFVEDCEEYVRTKFGLEDGTAADVVQEVWASFVDRPAVQLPNPKRYLRRACRWRALQVLRDRRQEREALDKVAEAKKDQFAPEPPEILIALEEEDKPRFYEGRVSANQEQVLNLLIEGHSAVEVSAILRVPASTVRMRVHLARKRLGA